MLKRILLAGALGFFMTGMVVAGDQEKPATEPQPASSAEKKDAEKKGNPVVLMETSLGTIKLELYPDKAPKTVENFLKYVKDGYYNETIFHRIVVGPSIYVVQGGGFTSDMDQKVPTYPEIPLESKNGLKNARGTIAMARLPQPNTATCQFFINQKDNFGLDYPKPDGNGYCVFGRVIDGLDTVDKIAGVETTTVGRHQGVPAEPILIKSVKAVS